MENINFDGFIWPRLTGKKVLALIVFFAAIGTILVVIGVDMQVAFSVSFIIITLFGASVVYYLKRNVNFVIANDFLETSSSKGKEKIIYFKDIEFFSEIKSSLSNFRNPSGFTSLKIVMKAKEGEMNNILTISVPISQKEIIIEKISNSVKFYAKGKTRVEEKIKNPQKLVFIAMGIFILIMALAFLVSYFYFVRMQ